MMNKEKESKKNEKENQTEIVPVEVLKEKPLILSDDFQTMEELTKQAEKQVDFVKKVKIISVRVTNYMDWINQDGNPYLEVSGTMKINQLWGVSISDQKIDIQTITDEKGTYKVVVVTGKGTWRGHTIEDVGTCTTRDQLFSKAYGVEKKQEDVSLENVIKAATTNFHNRLIKKIIGLKFTWEDLQEAGLDVEKIKEGRKVKHASKGQASTDEEKQKQIQIGKWLVEMHGEADAPGMLKIITAFTVKDEKTKKPKAIEGVSSCGQLRGKRLDINYSKVKNIHDKWLKNTFGEGKK
jgi:hypothetical protein